MHTAASAECAEPGCKRAAAEELKDEIGDSTALVAVLPYEPRAGLPPQPQVARPLGGGRKRRSCSAVRCYNRRLMSAQQPQPAAAAHRDQIAGLVERVTFHNDESGFCVLRIKARGHRELVTVVGTLPEVRAGEWLEAQGAWTIDKEYGQ